MGLRDVPAGRRVLDAAAETVLLRTRDPHEALAALRERDRQHVFLEVTDVAVLGDGPDTNLRLTMTPPPVKPAKETV